MWTNQEKHMIYQKYLDASQHWYTNKVEILEIFLPHSICNKEYCDELGKIFKRIELELH